MPSNRSPLATVRKTLRDTIKPLLPQRWRIVPSLEATKTLTVPAVYFVFGSVSPEADGQRLPPGHVFCDFDLVLVVPQKDTEKAEEAVDEALLDLILALEWLPDVAWNTAEKIRLETGQIVWRVQVSVLASTPQPTP
ncbi:hypothetical protein [Microbacterium sp. MTN4-26]|uniref:hypothetical protein n=1 Tax=unclassified Microbacterium TaxID=2609290 RepID=UPI0036F1B18F